jgi:hypothetical protein
MFSSKLDDMGNNFQLGSIFSRVGAKKFREGCPGPDLKAP